MNICRVRQSALRGGCFSKKPVLSRGVFSGVLKITSICLCGMSLLTGCASTPDPNAQPLNAENCQHNRPLLTKKLNELNQCETAAGFLANPEISEFGQEFFSVCEMRDEFIKSGFDVYWSPAQKAYYLKCRKCSAIIQETPANDVHEKNAIKIEYMDLWAMWGVSPEMFYSSSQNANSTNKED